MSDDSIFASRTSAVENYCFFFCHEVIKNAERGAIINSVECLKGSLVAIQCKDRLMDGCMDGWKDGWKPLEGYGVRNHRVSCPHIKIIAVFAVNDREL